MYLQLSNFGVHRVLPSGGRRAGKGRGLLKELPKELNAENVKFIIEHEAELQKLHEEMKGSAK